MKKKLIITDDDPAIQDVFKIMFEKAGFETILIPDGQVLLEGKFELPDLFILDKQLSGVDGLDICRHLKKDGATSHIPVIMLSATPDARRLAMLAGADAFMEKPFKLKELLSVTLALIDQNRKQTNIS